MADESPHAEPATGPETDPIVDAIVAWLETTMDHDNVAHALWMFGLRHGREPGDFTKCLYETIQRADNDNMKRLGLGFPEHVYLIQQFQRDEYGLFEKACQAYVSQTAKAIRENGG